MRHLKNVVENFDHLLTVFSSSTRSPGIKALHELYAIATRGTFIFSTSTASERSDESCFFVRLHASSDKPAKGGQGATRARVLKKQTSAGSSAGDDDEEREEDEEEDKIVGAGAGGVVGHAELIDLRSKVRVILRNTNTRVLPCILTSVLLFVSSSVDDG